MITQQKWNISVNKYPYGKCGSRPKIYRTLNFPRPRTRKFCVFSWWPPYQTNGSKSPSENFGDIRVFILYNTFGSFVGEFTVPFSVSKRRAPLHPPPVFHFLGLILGKFWKFFELQNALKMHVFRQKKFKHILRKF